MVKTLLKSVREYKKATILTPVFITLEVVMECLIPYVMALMIDTIDSAQAGSTDLLGQIVMYGGILIVMAAVSLTGGFLAGKYAAIASTGFARYLRHDLYYQIQKFSFANIDKFSTSSLVTRMTTDVTNVQNSFQMIIRIAIRCPLMFIFSLVMCITISPKMSMIYLIVVPVLVAALAAIIWVSYPRFTRVFKKYDAINESIQENVKAMRVVKSYVREDYEIKKFNRAAEDMQRDFKRADRIIALNNPLMSLCMHVAVLFISIFGAKLIMETGIWDPELNASVGGELTTGGLSSLITYNAQVLMSLMMLSMVLVMIIMSVASARRIVEVLNEESTLHNPEHPVYDVEDGSVEFENVSFRYSEKAEKNALEGINLKIKAGETVGILGGTGSSKSSLVQLIPRLYDTTEGVVRVGGRDVRDYGIADLRDAVAMVLQKNLLFSGTIKEDLRWGNPNATDAELEEACRLAQADEFVRSFPDGYDTKIEQGGTNVSGGQKQRLCIARALLKKPKILILDDSTSAVDTKTDALIRAGFRQYIPETTKIIIAQRVASVQDADLIVVMNNGRIEAKGTHAELMANSPIYREVYEQQTNGGAENEADE